MTYVDGYLVALPKTNIDAYAKIARGAGAVWMEHGALAYVENIGEDVPYGELTSFPRALQAKEDEVVIFSWIVYESRESRDAVNAKVLSDPRMQDDGWKQVFDGKRMIFGGFDTLVSM